MVPTRPSQYPDMPQDKLLHMCIHMRMLRRPAQWVCHHHCWYRHIRWVFARHPA